MKSAALRLIELETFISAPPERCFDLSLSVDLHLCSAAETSERVISGPTSGVLGLGDTVTWEGRHFGVRWRLTVRVTHYDRPRMFRDEMTDGPFRRLRHDHWFDEVDGGTRMTDAFEFTFLMPPLDALAARHLRRFLQRRAELIRRVAESDGWRQYLD
jgi:ligand-binding SRPBCC domain-containing protein